MYLENYMHRNIRRSEKLLTLFIICVIGIEVNFGFDGLNIGNLIVCLGSLVVILYSFKYRKSGYIIGIFFTSDFLFAFLLGIAYLVSSLWSISPLDTLAHSIFFFTILFSCYILRDVSVAYVIRLILLSAFWVGIFSIIALLISRDYALQPVQSTSLPELRGIFNHQQRLSLFMCLALGMAIIAIINKEKEDRVS